MSLLSWNCQGLGNPTAVHVLVDIVHLKRLEIIFLMETFVNYNRLQPIKIKMGYHGLFVVDNMGHSGGLALMWKEGTKVNINSYSRNHIDATVCLESISEF